MSLPVPGRPAAPCFERQVQYNANPFQCHRTIVSGLKTRIDSRHLCQIAERETQKSRSLRLKRAWRRSRFIIASCCRSARFSRARSVRFLIEDLINETRRKSASKMTQKPACYRQQCQYFQCGRNFGKGQRTGGKFFVDPPAKNNYAGSKCEFAAVWM